MLNTKRIIFAGAVFMIILTAVTASAFISCGSAKNGSAADTPDVTAAPPDEAVSVTPAKVSYVIREHDGGIGIFDGNGELIKKINLPVVLLPDAERQKLKEGYTVNSESELGSLIEDYTG